MKEFLSQKGIPYVDHDVTVDRSAAEEMIRKSGQTGVPVILVDTEVVVGFNRPKLEQLLAKASTGQRSKLGLQVADAAKTAPAGAATSGAYVGRVTPGALAEQAGIRQGDIITQINSQPVRTALDLEDALAALPMGSRAVITLLRGQQTLGVELVLRA